MGRGATTKRRQSNGIGSLMLSFTTFILGYLVASVFDISSLSHWMTNQFSTQTASNPKPSRLQTAELPKPKFEFYTLLTKEQSSESVAAANGIKPAASAMAAAPQLVAKPQTLVNTNNAVTAVSSVAKTEAPPLDLTVTQKLPLHEPLVAMAQPKPQFKAVPNIDKGRYIIQVGSFKNQHEAEKMKAALIMRGFSSVITSATQQQVTWYRVLIGPFPSLTDAQRVHREFAMRDRITGMIRKLDV